MLICPLCGRSSSLSKFDPSGFDDDIYMKVVRGLGRGRGFEVVSRGSIIGDNEVTQLIGDRILDLTYLLIRYGVLDPNYVLLRLHITIISPRVVNELRSKVDILTNNLEKTKKEVDIWKSRAERLKLACDNLEKDRNIWKIEAETIELKVEELKSDLDEWRKMYEEKDKELKDVYEKACDMCDDIDETLGYNYDDEGEGIMESLKERLFNLIDEFESAASDIEYE